MVSGIEISGICQKLGDDTCFRQAGFFVSDHEDDIFSRSDAVYIVSPAESHAKIVRRALEAGCHVLCESPIALSRAECESLFALAKEKNLILMEAIKTAYSQAYSRMLLLAKMGKIGQIVSVSMPPVRV